MAYTTKEITKIYLGDTKIKKVYLGDCPIYVPEFHWECDMYGCYELDIPYTGIYCVLLYGAQGGKSNSNAYDGGYGAVARGCIQLTQGDKLYVYIGEKGKDSAGNSLTATSFNGGGRGGGSYYRGNYAYNGGGGGGTDVRWNGDTLCNRFIVAGGGGGGTNHHSDSNTYFRGGGTSGCGGYERFRGTQTCAGSNGAFGVGGSGTSNGEGNRYSSPGGGGGWYGGGAETGSSDSGDRYNCAGGGSSYTWTEDTCVNHPNPSCLSGLEYITNAYCDVSAHTGDGYALICLVDT